MKSFKDCKIDFNTLRTIYGGYVPKDDETLKRCWETTCNNGAEDTYNQITDDEGNHLNSYEEPTGLGCIV